MQKSGGMDEFNDSGQDNRVPVTNPRFRVTTGAGGKNDQHGPQAFAAGTDDVFSDLADQYDFRIQTVANECVHCRHVGCSEIEYNLDVGRLFASQGVMGLCLFHVFPVVASSAL
jgi:hypothetical protein